MQRIFHADGRISAAPRHPDLVIAELAGRQHGVVGRVQLLAAGVTDRMIAHRIGIRRLFRLQAGAYSITEYPTRLGGFLAAVLACGDGALLSHRSAAALWDLIGDRGPVDVLIERGGQRKRPGIAVHQTRRLHPADIARLEGIPCTSVARTLVDCAGVLHRDDLRSVVERTIRLRLFDRRALDAALDRANGRRGTGSLRHLLAEIDPVAPTRSELERRFLDLVKNASLPSPITNGLVAGHEVDFHWPHVRLIVETDGRETHDNPFAFERDRQRDLDLKLSGWDVIRITWRQLREEPERIVALLRAKLALLGG